METSEEQCQICLTNNPFFNWTEQIFEFSGPSYKECFFRYTQQQEQEEDVYTQMLCLECAHGLRSTYQLVEKALESIKQLKELKSKLNSQDDVQLLDEYKVEEVILTDTEDTFKTNSEEQDPHQDIPSKETCKTSDNLETVSEYESEDSTSSTSEKPKRRNVRKKEPLICIYCSKMFKRRSYLESHEKSHEEKRERKEVCTVCGLKFYNRDILRAHQQIHKEDRIREKKCEFCPKAFFYTGALNIHRRIHLGKMVKCELCPKEFYRKIDLNRHLKSHGLTPIGSEKTYQKSVNEKIFLDCDVCGKKVERLSWNTHKARHLNEPVVKCSICSKTYYNRLCLTRHLRKVHAICGQYEEYVIRLNNKFQPRLSSLMKQQNIIINQTF